MQRIRSLLLALAALTMTPGLLSAQNTVTGVVSDEKSEPVIAAMVMVSAAKASSRLLILCIVK